MLVERLDEPISFQYQSLSLEEIEVIRQGSKCCIDLKKKHLIPLNSYRNEGRKGMQDYILTRRSVLEQLQIVAKQLTPHYSLLLFDTYRSLERKQYPDWRKENIEQETRKYAAHPNDPSQFAISPHNSGEQLILLLVIVIQEKYGLLVLSLMKSVNYLEQTFLKTNRIPTWD